MVLLWIGLGLFCIVGASYASRRAVTTALRIADSMKISPALVGVTIMAIGTDLPEIGNSLVASATGHGDVNVGDSMGSVVTQVTLVLGILCLASKPVPGDRSFILSVGIAAVFASATVWILVRDGALSHLDGLLLVMLWIAALVLLSRGEIHPREMAKNSGDGSLRDIGMTILWLGVVGAFAIGVVQSFLAVADRFGIPEFIGSFAALSIGTSLPELVVDWTAIRRGASSMAVGGVFGSSLVDATLSVGIGPLIFSSVVSSGAATGVALAGVGVLAATVLVARAERYGRLLGVSLIAVYLAVQVTTAVLQP